MSVAVQTAEHGRIDFADATHYETTDDLRGVLLVVYADSKVRATFAPREWRWVTVLPDPTDPALTEARDRAKRATEQVLIHEGWKPPQVAEAVNAAAPLRDYPYAETETFTFGAGTPESAASVAETTVETTFEATTTADGPFVSVSFTSNDAGHLMRLVREAFGDDDGTAGVLAKVPA
jgi:hypothetical protein